MDGPGPPYFFFQLLNVASLIPTFLHFSSTGVPGFALLQRECELLFGKFALLHGMTPVSQVKIMPEILFLNAARWNRVNSGFGLSFK
jgi:hypothetical protein